MLLQTWSYGAVFVRAAAITVWISWLALVLGAVLGVLVGFGRASPWPILKITSLVYTEVFRSIPVLILMFFCFFGLPFFLQIDISAFTAATLALTLTTSSLLAEVVRGGAQSIKRGQWDAAVALGLNLKYTMLLVIGPQALRIIVPPAVGVYVSTLKDSSVASVIGYVELTKAGLLIRDSTGDNFLPLAAVACLYFGLNYAISRLGAVLERKMKIVGY